MNKRELTKLENLTPCRDALIWVSEQPDPQTAWDSCERGDWMLWLLGKLSKGPRSKSRKQLVLAACECARLSLKYVKKGENRPKIAIETAERWANGDSSVSLRDVRNAANAANAVAYAAANAANAAYVAYAAAAYVAYAAAAYVAYVAYAAYAAKQETLKQCADIVRKHYPNPPKL